MGSSTDTHGEGMRGIPGIVTGIGTNSFTLATHLPPLMGKGMQPHGSTTLPSPQNQGGVGTTTLTVNVTASTTYRNGSSTASFSDITVGSRVIVIGQVSTSTKSVNATSVLIGIGTQGGAHEDNGRGNGGVSGQGGFLHSIGSFFGGLFGGGGNSGEGNQGGGPAAGFWNFLFGWMHS